MTALVVLAVLVGALAQSVSGIGFLLVCMPFLVGALGAHEGVRLGVVLSLLVNVGLLARHHRDLDRRGALLLLAPAAVATPVAAAAVRALPDRPAQAAAGGVIVLGTVLLAAGVRWRAARGAAGAVGVGIVSGVTNVVAGVAGPPVALWADNAGWSAGTTRATLQAYFLGLNVITLVSLGRPAHRHRPAARGRRGPRRRCAARCAAVRPRTAGRGPTRHPRPGGRRRPHGPGPGHDLTVRRTGRDRWCLG